MKMKSIVFSIGTIFLALAAIALPTNIFAETITLKVGFYDPEKHFLVQKVFLPYCAEIEKRTQGKVKFQYYHSGSLVKAGQSYDAVKNGIVDFMPVVALFTVESKFPVSKILTLPFLTEKGIQTNLVYQAAFESIPELRNEYEGVKITSFHATDLANISLTGSVVKTQADMKGLKIFAGSKTSVQLLNLLGATPRTIKLEDLYMSLQRKALDGVLFPTAPLVSYKLTDVLPSLTITMSACGLVPGMMNLKKWNSLPKDVQAVFEELKPSVTNLLGAEIDNRREWTFDQLKKRGDEVYSLPEGERTKWRATAQPLYDQWVKDMDAKEFDGQAIMDKIENLAKKYKNASYHEDNWWGNWKN